MAETGRLRVQVLNENKFAPIKDAKVTITQKNDTTTRDEIREILSSNESGRTEEVYLFAPPKDNSLTPTNEEPYSTCDIMIEADGYETLRVNGCQIFPQETALQNCYLRPINRQSRQSEVINIGANTLNGDYPAKIPEDPDKPLPPPASGFVVLEEPVVPEFVVVHTGVPNDTSAPNYTVPFKDYIKNVASSEIYATWSSNAIRANVYCILSFTLNRIYTEWYRGKGKNFDITNSTAYDHAFTYGRNIFENISVIVDEIFTTYIKRWDKKQPLLTQYCDGKKVQCPGWLTQWGSQALGEQGKSPYEILTHFYGTDIEFKKAKKVEGIPKSYPGYALSLGSSGAPVRNIQTYLNRISNNFPAIPKVKVDGVYGEATQQSVKKFQEIFNLPQTGIVDYATWYKISDVYVAVTRIAELRGSSIENKIFIPPTAYRDLEDVPKIEYPYDY